MDANENMNPGMGEAFGAEAEIEATDNDWDAEDWDNDIDEDEPMTFDGEGDEAADGGSEGALEGSDGMDAMPEALEFGDEEDDGELTFEEEAEGEDGGRAMRAPTEEKPEGEGEAKGKGNENTAGEAGAQPDARAQTPATVPSAPPPISTEARELAILKAQVKDTLDKLGVGELGIDAGLIKLAAEADDISPEEYVRRRDEGIRRAEARRVAQAAAFEQKARADLTEVQAAYPETKAYASVRDLPNFAKFGEFRDKGLTPKEAYIAANPDRVREQVAEAVRQKSMSSGKEHLRSAVSKESKDTSITMTRRQMAEYRELFPDKSDREIMALHRAATKK